MPPAKTQPKPASTPANANESLPVFYLDIDSWDSGMPDDFVGTIAKSRFAAWKYPNKEKYQLFLRWDIDIEEEDGRVWRWREHLGAGWLRDTQPSNDDPTLPPTERKPAGTTREVYLAMAEGTASIEGEDETLYEGLYTVGRMPTQDSDARQALKSLRTLGFDLTGSPGADVVEGVRARFMRMPQHRQLEQAKKKSGIVVMPKEGEAKKEKEFKVLEAVELLPGLEQEQGNGTAATAKPKPASTGAKPATAQTASDNANGSDGDFEDRLGGFMMGILAEAGGTMNRHALLQKLMPMFPEAEKFKKLVPLWNKSGFTKFPFISFDKASGTVGLAETEE